MNQITQFDQTMTSLELLSVINYERKARGEADLRRNVFHSRVADELEGLNYKTFVIGTYDGEDVVAFDLTADQALLVAMRESKHVRRAVLRRMRALEVALLDEKLTDHGQIVRDRTFFEITSRTTKVENELRDEIKELRRQLAESAITT